MQFSVNLYDLQSEFVHDREQVEMKSGKRVLGFAPILQADLNDPYSYTLWWPLADNTWANLQVDGSVVYEESIATAREYGEPTVAHNHGGDDNPLTCHLNGPSCRGCGGCEN